MSDPTPDSPRDAYFEDLLVRYLDGGLSPDEFLELNALLEAVPARCEQLAELAYQVKLMQELPTGCLLEGAGPSGGSPPPCGPAPSEPPQGGQAPLPGFIGHLQEGWQWFGDQSWSFPVVLFVAAVTLTLGGVLATGIWRQPAPEPELAKASNTGIATLTQGVNCSWASSVVPQIGEPLQQGRLDLLTGIAEIQFQQGATVILEGPASLELVDANRAVLQSGRAVAKVPKSAVGFGLDTPAAHIVDLGTEFGVAVSEAGSTLLQVYNGKVVAGRWEGGAPRRELIAGQAVSFDANANQPPGALPFVPDRFLREMPPAASRGKDELVPYNVSRSDTLHLVPAPKSVVVDGDLSEWDRSGGAEARSRSPYGDDYWFQGYLMYDRQYLYVAARVGDPYPMRNSVPLEPESTLGNVSWKGGSVQLWLSTDRKQGWPLEAESPFSFDSRQKGRGFRPQDTNDRLVSLTMFYYRPQQRPCLLLGYGMDRHGLTMAAEGWKGTFHEAPEGRGYIVEYAIPWRLLGAEHDPPQGGDVLAGAWMVHWSDETGRIWKGHVIEGRRAGIDGYTHMKATTWGRVLCHDTGHLAPETTKLIEP
jgi:hypothetical protein